MLRLGGQADLDRDLAVRPSNELVALPDEQLLKWAQEGSAVAAALLACRTGDEELKQSVATYMSHWLGGGDTSEPVTRIESALRSQPKCFEELLGLTGAGHERREATPPKSSASHPNLPRPGDFDLESMLAQIAAEQEAELTDDLEGFDPADGVWVNEWVNVEEALEALAERGDIPAMRLTAQLNDDSSMYAKIAMLGDIDAILTMAALGREYHDPDTRLEWLTFGHEQGAARASLILAGVHLGTGRTEQAIETLTSVANAGSAGAGALVALIHFLDGDADSAREAAHAAARATKDDPLKPLATLLSEQLDGPAEDQWLSQPTDLAEAMFQAAQRLSRRKLPNGEGANLADWYEVAAELGHAPAAAARAEEGEMSTLWSLRAAQLGDVDSMYSFACALMEYDDRSDGDTYACAHAQPDLHELWDAEDAEYWLGRAAEQGHEAAQEDLEEVE